jgi:hypothetical protein
MHRDSAFGPIVRLGREIASVGCHSRENRNNGI